MSFQRGDKVICTKGKCFQGYPDLLAGQECTITRYYTDDDGDGFVNILGWGEVELYAHRFELLPPDGASAITCKIKVMEQRFKERKENGYHLAA
jgi:hypothetical protein